MENGEWKIWHLHMYTDFMCQFGDTFTTGSSGGTTPGRFGRDYFAPMMGVSIGMAVCLGRECGRSVGKQIRGEIFYPDELR